jgi:PiT family inorganic phosphate transporter
MDAGLVFPLLVALVLVALAFDFLNGMNDAANSIATVVSTRVLRPHYAVAWAAFFNFIAFLVFGLHVAETIGRGIVQADIVDARVIFGALTGAIVWQIITNRLGIPSSSSHALIGGLVGAGIAKAGTMAVVWTGVLKTVSGIVLAPGLGCLTALLLVLLVSWAFVRFTPFGADRFFRRAQLISASC